MAQITKTPPSTEEAALAREIAKALASHDDDATPLRLQLRGAGEECTTLDLPPTAARLLKQLVGLMADGQAVTLAGSDTEVTTQQAADLLNVSRPYLIGMIDKGIFPARMVGNQRRLPLADVLTYKAESRVKQQAALRELSALDQKMGLR